MHNMTTSCKVPHARGGEHFERGTVVGGARANESSGFSLAEPWRGRGLGAGVGEAESLLPAWQFCRA